MNLHGLSKLMRWSVASLLIFSAILLKAQTQYVGPDNGDWLTATNWNNGLPAAGNDATIGGGAIVVINGTLNINFNINNFGTIANAGTTTVSGNLIGGIVENRAGASLTFNAGSQANINNGFTNAGTLTNRGAINLNTVAWTNTATGVFINEGSVENLVSATNNGTITNKAGTFNSPQAFTNNKTVENLAGATFKIDFGGAYRNEIGSTLSNAGNFINLGNFTNGTVVNNTGTFTNNNTHACNGTFNNENGARFESTSTVNLTGLWNNKAGATVQNNFNFNVLANGFVNNQSAFQNNASINIALSGTFSNEAGATVPMGFGSSITNAGDLLVKASSSIAGNGSINNSRVLEIGGTVDLQNGASLTNMDRVFVNGLLKNVNTITNNGTFTVNGIFDNNSGGSFTNNTTFLVNKGGVVNNGYEVYNKPSATITNNGTFNNNIRLFNESTVTNNAYFVSSGDFLNQTGGTLNNTEVFVVREGSIQNKGTVTNTKTIINEACGIISNTASISNNGRLENRGIIFQRGTVTGNAISAVSGYLHTGTGSAAPTLCKTSLTTGTDAGGEAKVYGQNGFLTGLSIDECAGFQYFANGVPRYVYLCSQIGQTLNTSFKIITRTGDSLTCNVPTTIFDNVSPVVENCPKDVTVLTTQNTATYTWAAVTGLDNCGDVPTVTSTHASGSAFPVGNTKITISVKDSRSNTTDCIFNVNVVKVTSTATCPATDGTAPVFTNCPANITISTLNAGAVATWNTPSVSDNCYPIVVTESIKSGTFFPVGSHTVTYSAKDPSGNIGTCSFSVTINGSSDPCVTDAIKPVITNCPANFFGIVNTAINGAVGYWIEPKASDNCGAVTLTGSAKSGTIFNAGTTTITYTATDAKNNATTCSFNVYIEATDPCAGDVTGPVFANCPTTRTVNTTGLTATSTWTAPTATDACSGVVINASHQSGNTFGLGTTVVTYQASDKKGNLSFCTFNVNVVNTCLSDTTKPVLSACPANITVQTAGTSATATWTAPTATDNCSTPVVTSNYNSGSTFQLGATTVVYTATDINGNSSTCNFTVTINQNACLNDVTPPTFANCPTNRPAVIATATCGATVTWTAPTASDNCGTPTVTVTSSPTAGLTSGSCFPVGTTTITYKATDAKGLIATCSFTVTVNANACLNDVTPPTFANCPTNRPAVIATATCGATVTWTAPTASDNCGTPTVTVTSSPTAGLNSGSCFPVGTTTITYRATDAKGLTTTCSFTATVNAAPTGFDPNKCYRIVSALSSKAIDVSGGSKSNDAKIIQWSWHGGANQIWQIVPTSNGYYKIVNANSNKVIACHYTFSGSPIYQYDYYNDGSKDWKIESVGGGYKFTHRLSGRVMTIPNFATSDGTQLTINSWSNTNNQIWRIEEVACPAPAPCISSGSVLVERWNNYTDWRFPLVVPTTTPSVTTTQGNTQGAWNIGDNYFTRVRGYFKPATSGTYYFNVTGDDNIELFLSTNNSPSTMTRIAYINGWTYELEYNKYTNQTSSAKTLQANQLYYFELRHREGGGWDGWRISARMSGTSTWQPIQSQYLARPCSNTFQALTSKEEFAFDATAVERQAKLQWISNTGYKNDYFIVERTNEAGIFETLDKQNAYTGDDALNTYDYTDINPIDGDNYYRITTIANDGTPQYSDVKKVSFSKSSDVQIFPNPADEYVNIDLRTYEGKSVTIYVYNAMGKMLNRVVVEKASTSLQRLDIQSLNTGSYLIRIQTEGKRDVMKQIKVAK